MDNTPTFSQEEIQKGRSLLLGGCTFMLSVVKTEDLPAFSHNEICFAGRSNVGKSSLVNALTNRNTLAKTSNTPGRTQCLNFFNVQDILYLVDMPGYGYAEAPKKLVKQWHGLIREYLLGRPTLKRVYVLIDSRHGIKENDKAMLTLLDECAVSYQVILTKADKISESERKTIYEKVSKTLLKHPAAHPYVHITSSGKGWGIDELRADIARLV